MKNIFLKTKSLIEETNLVTFIDRDKNQIDNYDVRPAVKFPCALINIAITKRKNLDSKKQLCNCTITVRVAFERKGESSNISSQSRIDMALSYYDTVDGLEAKLQGYEDSEVNPFECLSTIDEQRPDFDVVRLTFATSFIKQF